MFEEDLFEAFQFLNEINKQKTAGASKDYEETKELGILKTLSPCDVTEHQRTEIPERKQACVVGVHKSIKEWRSSSDESFLTHHKPVANAKRFDNVQGKFKRDEMCPSVSGITITTPLMKELDKKGFLVKDTEAMKREKELEKPDKRHVFSDKTFQYFSMGSKTLPPRDDVYVAEASKGTGCFYSTSTKNDAKTGKANCSEKDVVNEAFSLNENHNGTMKILADAVQDINDRSDKVHQYLSFGRSNIKKGKAKERECISPPLDHNEMYKNPDDIQTLGDSVRYFALSSHLQKLEMSLEDVRRNKKSKEDHEDSFKEIDKEIQKLSFKYHPDRVKNRGGTEEEITTAQKLQTAINATRTVLKLLNSAFIEDLGTEHKFGFYTKLGISSLSNEDEIKYRIYEVIFKISVISRIKQQNIISEIRKFLIESKNCVHSYLGSRNDFEKYRDLALFHLKCCVKGFKKLCIELEEVKEQCKSEKNSENMLSLIQNMANDSRRDLKQLKDLKKMAKTSLKGKCLFFSPEGYMDPYFVLPLVSYTNVILMCNVMVRNSSVLDILNIHFELDPPYRNDLSYLMTPYYLASYCSGNKNQERTVLKIMDKINLGLKVQLSKEEIEFDFYKHIEQNDVFMEYKFKVEDYNEAITTNLLMLDLKKCMTMMTEFQEKEEELSKGIKEFQKKADKMDRKYEKFDKMMEATEELNQKIKERLEKSKRLSEKVSSALSDQL